MTQPPVDLTNCDREPIHIPGAIQPHGLLFSLRYPDCTVQQVSANLPALTSIPVDEVLGQPIESFLATDDARKVRAVLFQHQGQSKPLYLFTLQTITGQGPFDAIAHFSGDLAILELEPARQPDSHTATDLYRLVQRAITRLQESPTLQDMFDTCAEEIRRINGFDRVMVYRFDRDWNGIVVAEDKRPGLEPFLGLHYPASDIPAQARELYRRNRLRFIADRDYAPAPLVPPADLRTGDALDMSFAVLRSVSPIHLEYLRNMSVAASMSVSLLKDGKFWGLVACHHYSPRFVPYEARTACELLGQIMSLQLTTREDQELAAYSQQMHDTCSRLVARMRDNPDLAAALTEASPHLLDLLDAQGAAVVNGDDVARIGQTPGEDEIRALSTWLADHHPASVYSTDYLADAVQNSGTLSAVAAGLLAVSLTRQRRLHVLWFRPEQIRTVNWAGDPAKTVSKGPEGVRLSPRGSFALWKETVRGRSNPWTPAELAVARDFRAALVSLLLGRAEQLAAEHSTLLTAGQERERQLEGERAARSSAERLSRMKDEFVATLSHELRTPLNAILGWTQLLRRGIGSHTDDELAETAETIERNARVQAQMIEDLLDVSRITSGKLRLDVQPVSLPTVVESAIATLQPAAAAKNVRIHKMLDPLTGIEVTGDPSRLQQVFWNLLSNAIKFTPKGGKVQVLLERVNSHVEISIADTGQGISPEFLPHVFDRFRQENAATNRTHGGLGLGLAIVRHLVELHGGTVQADSAGAGQGATFTVSLPMRVVRRPSSGAAHPTHATSPVFDCDRLNLEGVRVLVLDDEPDARELVRRLLLDCRATPTPAATVDEALSLIRTNPFDVIISDIGMPSQDGYAFISRLRKLEDELHLKRHPAIALTAYARAEDRSRIMLAGFQVHVAKPVEAPELLATVANLAGRI